MSRAGAVLIMAGGTGGHIFPGLAVADALCRRHIPVRWLGAEGAMECLYVPAAGIDIDTLEISGLRGKGISGWIKLPLQLFRAVRKAFVLFGEIQPCCALSFGGYAAGPGGLAARLRGIPLLVHEQNRIPGLTNRVLARLAQSVFQAFPGSWPERVKATTCGNPVRRTVAELPLPEVRLREHTGKPRLLITGGSQGARTLNTVVPRAIAMLPEKIAPEIRHQSGKGSAEQTTKAYAEQGVSAVVEEFIDDMAQAYAWADLVVCRAGALTISELAAAGIGAILVPFPHAVDDHQTRNAEFLARIGAARLLPEPQCDAEQLSRLLEALLGDRQGLLRMAKSARSVAMPDAADRIANACMGYAKP